MLTANELNISARNDTKPIHILKRAATTLLRLSVRHPICTITALSLI